MVVCRLTLRLVCPRRYKLKDIAAFALPIAASIAAPYLIPAAWGLGAVGAGAIGAGVGGFGAGLIQGKGLKDSLVQGGISGLMSYGMGSMMAPGTMTGGAGQFKVGRLLLILQAGLVWGV
jgi:hypothetical protein